MASTFKIPHALAALDAGVVSGADEVIKYDGAPTTMEAWNSCSLCSAYIATSSRQARRRCASCAS